jgi:hypothetical protein
VFSGKAHPSPGAKAVFFCYAMPAPPGPRQASRVNGPKRQATPGGTGLTSPPRRSRTTRRKSSSSFARRRIRRASITFRTRLFRKSAPRWRNTSRTRM